MSLHAAGGSATVAPGVHTASRRGCSARFREFSGLAQVMTGSAAYLGLGLLAHLIAANGLTAEEFATLSLAAAFMAILQEVGGSGIDEALVRHAAPLVNDDPAGADRLLAGTLLAKCAISGGLAVGLWMAAPALATWLGAGAGSVAAYRWAAVGSLGSAAFGWALAVLQARRAFGAYAVLRPTPTVFKAIGFGTVWVFGVLTLPWALAVSSLTFLPALLILPWLTPIGSLFRVDSTVLTVWTRVFAFAGWLIVAKVLFALYSRIDLLLLERAAGASAVAAYAVAGNLLFMIDLTTFAVIVSLLPEASAVVSRDDLRRYVVRARDQCLVLGALIVPLVALAGPVVQVLYAGRYLDAVYAFRVLSIGALATLLVHPLYLLLYARNKPHLLAVVNLVQVVVCGALAWRFVQTDGIRGAAWSSAAARLVGCMLILVFVWREARLLSAELQEAIG